MNKKTLIITTVLMFVFVTSTMFVVSQSRSTTQIPNRILFKSSGLISSPINITNNADLALQASSGNGSSGNPYIIENYDISHCSSYVSGVNIQNTNQFFILRNITVLSCFNGIYFKNVTFGSIISSSALNNTEAGFELDLSNNNSLIGNTATTNHFGFYINSSSNENILLSNTAIYNRAYGFFLSTSFNNRIENNTGHSNAYYDYFEFMSAGNTLNNNMFSNTSSPTVTITSVTSTVTSDSITFGPGTNWLFITIIIIIVVFIIGSGIVIVFRINSTRMNAVQTLKNEIVLSKNMNKTPGSAFCPTCGSSVMPEDQYCLNCGTKLRT